MKQGFEKAIEEYKVILDGTKQKYNLTGYTKLILFILFVVNIYFIIANWDNILFKITAGLLFAIQVAAWLYQFRLDDRIQHAAGMIEINQRHLDRVTGKWSKFDDTGENFWDSDHPYCADLDIVGNKSLFQYLNTSHTWHGRQAFKDDLLKAQFSKQEIENRQTAIKELADDHSFGNELEYQFSRVGSDPAADDLVKEFQSPRTFIKNRVLRFALTYGSLIVFLFIAATLIFQVKQFYGPSVILFVIQLLIWLFSSPKCQKFLKVINRLPFKLNRYSQVLAFVSESKWNSDKLTEIQANLVTSDKSAAQAIKELARVADMASIRSNAIISFVLNTLLLWDYRCAFRLADWSAKYAPHCETWFLSLGELESLLCFATLPKVCDHTCIPDLSEERGLIAKEIGHPLISNSDRITNPLKLIDQITIISGSNMSGKTTYLRTVGINLVLARAGAHVCAREMTCSDLHVITSMRIADDLNEGISTFYAELKRIKGVLDAAKTDANTLFLIDEIFRGTNSVDRLTGAKTVITKLSQIGAIGMITTHDLELCQLEQDVDRIINASFSEHYEEGKICFHYKIEDGKSKTTNAKHLMELIGIL